MKFKQKIAYMALGSLFTLAGYFLATLTTGGITPQTATAQQDNPGAIADVIQCRELQIINKEGKAVASFSSTMHGDGELIIINKNGKTAIEIGTNSGQGGLLAVYNNAGKEVALLVSSPARSGNLILRDKVGNKTVGVGISKITNESLLEMFDSKLNQVVRIGTVQNGGLLNIKNKDDKSVVLIGVDENGNGVISNFKGSWRTH